MKKIFKILTSTILSVAVLAGCSSYDNATTADKETADTNNTSKSIINLYTARNYDSDALLFDDFYNETGIKVNVVSGKAEELIERLKTEGDGTGADLFMTVDGGVLDNAKKSGILEPVNSDIINENVTTNSRDKENYWTGIATRARVIAYSKERVNPDELSTYEDLANEKWKSKILVRSSTSLYNQSLVASLISINGAEATEKWLSGLVNNFARSPEGNDRDQAKAVVAGVGDIAIMNTYYIGLLLNSSDPEEKKVGESIGVFFPNQQTTGTHVNISGIGLIKYSKNKENAIKLMEYMTSVKAQEQISNSNFEFPVNIKAKKAPLLESWGDFKMQEIDFSNLNDNNIKSIELMGKVGWK